MKGHKMTENQYQKNVALLEQLALERDIAVTGERVYGNEAQMLDVAVATLAKYGPHVLLQDILEAEELNSSFTSDSILIRFIEQLHTSWFQPGGLIAGASNLLNAPAPGSPWQYGYKHELAKAVAANGTVMSLNASYYGWKDYDLAVNKPTIVAVLDVKEDAWGEFVGTFNTSDEQSTGFTATVILTGNRCRRVRWETDIHTVIQQITQLPGKK